MTKPYPIVEDELDVILKKYFTGEQHDEIHGRFIRIPFTKQMDEAKAAINAYITNKIIEARIKTLRDLPDVRLGGDDAQWFEDYLWKEIEKLEAELKALNPTRKEED
jgi:hypothetical protein